MRAKLILLMACVVLAVTALTQGSALASVTTVNIGTWAARLP